MVEGEAPAERGPARIVADLHEQNERTRRQLAQTRFVAERFWELWAGEAAALLGAEWELADGRARALLDEELAILALLPKETAGNGPGAQEAVGTPPTSSASGGQRGSSPSGSTGDAKNPRGEEWNKAELFELMQHATRHFQAQEQELAAALAARGELVGQVERHMGEDGSSYAAEHRHWLKRAEDVVQRLSALGAGMHAASEAYVKASRMNTRMFRADLFAAEAAPALAETAQTEDGAPGCTDSPPPHGFLRPRGHARGRDRTPAQSADRR